MREIWVEPDELDAVDVGYVFASVATYEFAGLRVTFNCWALDKMIRIYWGRRDWPGADKATQPPPIFAFIWNDALTAAVEALKNAAAQDSGPLEASLSANLAVLSALKAQDHGSS